jgi:hypothetical protein
MWPKLRYYLRRVFEAPPYVTLQKLWLKGKPFVYRPVYAMARRASPAKNREPDHRQRQHSIDFGRSLSQLLLAAGQADSSFAARASARARRAIDGLFPCLGYGEATIPHGWAWHDDLFGGHRWPDAYFPNVDFIAAGIRSDVKVPWELSRLQFLVWLAEGALFDANGSAQYRARFAEIASDWFRYNVPAYGVNWTCAMEVGIRAVNLFFRGSG